MRNQISIVLTSLSMLILLNSCGVMFGGSRYQGTIIAKDHPNADIYVNGQKAGKGQVYFLLRRR